MVEELNPELKTEEAALKANLEILDSLIMQDAIHKIAAIDLGTARNCIQQIQDTLKKSPVLDSILINKDVRNIITFIRETRDTFMAASSERVEKKATRVVKDTAKAARNQVASNIVGAMFKPGGMLASTLKITAAKPNAESPGGSSPQSAPHKVQNVPDSLEAFAKGVMPTEPVKNVSALDAFAAFAAKIGKDSSK